MRLQTIVSLFPPRTSSEILGEGETLECSGSHCFVLDRTRDTKLGSPIWTPEPAKHSD